jgi:hypothetical protein
LSLEERYSGRQDYLDKISAATRNLVAGGYVLESDAPTLKQRAEMMWDYLTAQK